MSQAVLVLRLLLRVYALLHHNFKWKQTYNTSLVKITMLDSKRKIVLEPGLTPQTPALAIEPEKLIVERQARDLEVWGLNPSAGKNFSLFSSNLIL